MNQKAHLQTTFAFMFLLHQILVSRKLLVPELDQPPLLTLKQGARRQRFCFGFSDFSAETQVDKSERKDDSVSLHIPCRQPQKFHLPTGRVRLPLLLILLHGRWHHWK